MANDRSKRMKEKVPVEERVYRVTPTNQSWNVKGGEAGQYYERFEGLKVGQEYKNSAYTIVRTNNRKSRRKKLWKLFGRR